jgi:hypothetical protein
MQKTLFAALVAVILISIYGTWAYNQDPLDDFNPNLGVALDQDNGAQLRKTLILDGVAEIEGHPLPDGASIGLVLKMADGSRLAFALPNPGARAGSGPASYDLANFKILLKQGLTSSDADTSAFSVDEVAADLRKVLQQTATKLAEQKATLQQEAANRKSWTAKP